MAVVFKKGIQDGRKLSRAFLAAVSTQHMSTASTEATPEKITKNISYRPAYDSPIEESSRPMVLLYGWLVAKSKHIYKYGDFYLNKGFDVLHIKVNPDQLLWPRNAQGVIQNVLDFTNDLQHQNKPLLVHGFSVGGYLFGETLAKIHDEEKFHNVGARIQGQVLDSPVDFHGIPNGVSKAVTPNPLLQRTLKFSIDSYLKIFEHSVMKHYVRSSEEFRGNRLDLPTLMLYSTADIIGDYKRIEEVAQVWCDRGLEVYSKRWDDTKHVQHFQQHPVDYITALNMFLQKIRLVQDTELRKERIVMEG